MTFPATAPDDSLITVREMPQPLSIWVARSVANLQPANYTPEHPQDVVYQPRLDGKEVRCTSGQLQFC